MAFYKKRVTYEELSPHIQKFLELLRRNSSVIQEGGEGQQEVFYVDKTIAERFSTEFYNAYQPLRMSKFVTLVPYDYDHLLVYFDPAAAGPQPTVSSGYIRLPKLPYLINFIPEDLFLLLRLIATAKTMLSGDSIALDLGAAGCPSLEASAVYPYFTKLRVNYRMNPDYCESEWTPRDAISTVANMPPTRDNQLSALQYLTAIKNPDLIYFPLETMIEIGVDWEQMNDQYCVPKN
jgi:hypothetical protein